MDLALDSKQSRALNCSTCDSGMQKLRNCGGQYGNSKAPIKVNERIYRTCPKSLTFGHNTMQYCASLYFDFKETKKWPFAGGIPDQTAYLRELFDFLDNISFEYQSREHEKMMRESNKQNNSFKK